MQQHRRAPTAIQTASINAGQDYRDLAIASPTGSGKTLAYGLVVLTELGEVQRKRRPRRPKAIVLVPTRELATQVATELAAFQDHTTVHRVVPIVGGESLGNQEQLLQRGVDIVVATPGRLVEHIRQGTVIASAAQALVIDEADLMVQHGFIDDVNFINSEVDARARRLVVSATLDLSEDVLAAMKPCPHSTARYAVDIALGGRLPCEEVLAGRDNVCVVYSHDKPAGETLPKLPDKLDTIAVDTTGQSALMCALWTMGIATASHSQKSGILPVSAGQVIVFTTTKNQAKELGRRMSEYSRSVGCLHGDLTQQARTECIEKFKDGTYRILVATDVAGRGIHVDDVRLVVNWLLPSTQETFIHRAGRTARAGNTGVVVTLVQESEDVVTRYVGEILPPGCDERVIAAPGGLRAKKVAAPRVNKNPRVRKAQAGRVHRQKPTRR